MYDYLHRLVFLFLNYHATVALGVLETILNYEGQTAKIPDNNSYLSYLSVT